MLTHDPATSPPPPPHHITTVLKTPKDESESWWQVETVSAKKKMKGYVPGNCMVAEGSIDLHEWCHGAINRSAAEYLLVKKSKDGYS